MVRLAELVAVGEPVGVFDPVAESVGVTELVDVEDGVGLGETVALGLGDIASAILLRSSAVFFFPNSAPRFLFVYSRTQPAFNSTTKKFQNHFILEDIRQRKLRTQV